MTGAPGRGRAEPVNPDVTLLRGALDELIRLWFDTQCAIVDESKVTKFRLVYGPIAHAIYMAEAARFLLDHGRLPAAQPLARVALEHAVTAMWVHQHPDGAAGMADKILLDVTTYFRNAESILADWIEARSDVPQGSIRQQKRKVPRALIDFKQATSDLGADWLYVEYITLSGSIHAGIQTLDAYYLEDPKDPSGIALLNAQIDVELLPVLHILAIACTFSLGAYADMTGDDALADSVEAIARGIDVPPLLAFSSANTQTVFPVSTDEQSDH